MYDRWEHKVLAGVTEANPDIVQCKINRGILTDLVMYFPKGCHNLVKSRVFLGEKQVAPRSTQNLLAANDMAIVIHNLNELISEPVLNWFLWSPECTFPHTLWMSAEWLSIQKPLPPQKYNLLEDVFKRAKKMII